MACLSSFIDCYFYYFLDKWLSFLNKRKYVIIINMKNKMNFKMKNNAGSAVLWIAIVVVILGAGVYFMFSSLKAKSTDTNIINTQSNTTRTVTKDLNGTKVEINYVDTTPPEDTSKYTQEQKNILNTLKLMNPAGNAGVGGQ